MTTATFRILVLRALTLIVARLAGPIGINAQELEWISAANRAVAEEK